MSWLEVAQGEEPRHRGIPRRCRVRGHRWRPRDARYEECARRGCPAARIRPEVAGP